MKADTTEISPITGKKSVIVEVIDGKTSKICMESGYMTNDDFNIKNTELLEKYEDSMPRLMIDTKYMDEDLAQYWYLTSIQFKTGMIYPQPCTHSQYEWAYTPVVSLDSEERKQYPVPGKTEEYYETRLATEQTELYQQYNFTGACRRAGALVDANE